MARTRLKSFREIVDFFGTTPRESCEVLADILDVDWRSVHMWRHRDSIPPEYYPELADVMTGWGYAISLHDLHTMRAARFRPRAKDTAPEKEAAQAS